MVSLGRILDRYQSVGLGLAVFGAPFAVYSFLVLLSVPLTALGLACVVLGVSITMVPESPVPSDTIRAMVEASCVGVEAVLEEFNARERAAYLPPRDGRVVAYIPFKAGDYSSSWRAQDAPLRVVTEVGGEPALMVFPPGSEIVRLAQPEREGGESDVEGALEYVLVDFLEAVESVKSLSVGERVVVEIRKPRIVTEFPRFNAVLGSLPTSVSGCVVAHVLGKPVRLVEEHSIDGGVSATFEVPPGSG